MRISGEADLVPAQPGRIRDDLEEAKREVRSLAARVGNLEVGLTGRLDHRSEWLDPSPV